MLTYSYVVLNAQYLSGQIPPGPAASESLLGGQFLRVQLGDATDPPWPGLDGKVPKHQGW